MKDKMYEAEIELSNGGKWTIIHNLPGTVSQNIESALDNYLSRHDKPTSKGFCSYLHSKGFKAWVVESKKKIVK